MKNVQYTMAFSFYSGLHNNWKKENIYNFENYF